MLRLTVIVLLALSTSALLSADQAESFFDDSTVREIRLYFDDPNWYNTLLQGHNSTADPYFPAMSRAPLRTRRFTR